MAKVRNAGGPSVSDAAPAPDAAPEAVAPAAAASAVVVPPEPVPAAVEPVPAAPAAPVVIVTVADPVAETVPEAAEPEAAPVVEPDADDEAGGDAAVAAYVAAALAHLDDAPALGLIDRLAVEAEAAIAAGRSEAAAAIHAADMRLREVVNVLHTAIEAVEHPDLKRGLAALKALIH